MSFQVGHVTLGDVILKWRPTNGVPLKWRPTNGVPLKWRPTKAWRGHPRLSDPTDPEGTNEPWCYRIDYHYPTDPTTKLMILPLITICGKRANVAEEQLLGQSALFAAPFFICIIVVPECQCYWRLSCYVGRCSSVDEADICVVASYCNDCSQVLPTPMCSLIRNS